MRTTKRLGWLPDLPDNRDKFFKLTKPPEVLPPSIDMRQNCGPVYDQGDLGSCTANAIAGAINFETLKAGEPAMLPSRLFIYYDERLIEGTVSTDSGAQLRDGIKSLVTYGVCPETDWTYNVNCFAIKPGPQRYVEAAKDLLSSYLRVTQDASHMKGCLAAGFPFVAGFSVYESFEWDSVAASGIVPYPGPDEAMIGGHAVLVVGYDDKSSRFICQNSWGSDWGMAGFFTIPYSYFENSNLASDFWTIRKMEL